MEEIRRGRIPRRRIMFAKRVLIFSILLLCLVPVLCGPVLSEERPFNLPPTEKAELSNGLEILLMEKTGLPLIVFQLLVPAGSADDPQGKEGLANLTASLLRKGTTSRTAREVAEQVDFLGADLSIDTRKDRTILSLEVMAEDGAFAAELLADLVMNPSFVVEEFDKEKQNILASIKSDKDDPWRYASPAFRRFLLQGHPYAHPVEGHTGSVESTVKADVEAFHRRSYGPEGTILAVVGDFEKKEMLKFIKKNFSGWRRTGKISERVSLSAPARCQGRKICIVGKPDATQTQLRLGNVSFARNSVEFFPALVANTILGGGFSSRLINEVRVNRGLTYSISSRFLPYEAGGVFYVGSFTKTESTGEALRVILEEMEKLLSAGVTDDELERAKNYLNGQFPLSLETPEDLADLLLEMEFYGLPSDYAATYRSKVSSVTREEVTEIARRYFGTSDMAILAVGKPTEIAAQLEGLGEVETRDMDWNLLGAAE